MTAQIAGRRVLSSAPRGGSRVLILVVILVAILVALVPIVIGHGRNVRLMREGLEGALTECRARYAAARSAEDTASADRWVPRASGVHEGDPACGSYRRRNMLSHAE